MKLEVFTKDFVRLGIINSYSVIRYTDLFFGVGSFDLQCELNPQTVNLLFGEKDRILWIENEVAGIIQYNQRESVNNTKELLVRGNLLDTMLEWRYIYPQFNMQDKPDNILRSLVQTHCVDNPVRTIPHLSVKTETSTMTNSIVYQQTGSLVNTECMTLCETHNLGYEIAFMPKQQKYEFRVLTGKDRTVLNTQGNKPVVFSTQLNNILQSTYTNNREPFRNVALVAGEGEGTARVTKVLNDTISGFERREIFVDARDLQSVTDDSTTLTTEQYQDLLNQRGLEKLQDCVEIESFESVVRTDSKTQFKYGIDYYKGDKVTVLDRDLGVSISAIVTGVTITQDSTGYTVEPTFGFGLPTISQKLKKKGVI